MDSDLTLHLTVAASLATAGLLFGGQLAAWLLQLYYHYPLLNHNRFIKHYERFASRKAYGLLTKRPQHGLPSTYQDYKAFHSRNRRFAYLYCIRHLLIIAGLSLTILFVFGTMPALLARAYQPFYLAFSAVISLHLFYAVVIRRRRRNFYHLLTMGSVLSRLNPFGKP